MSWRLSSTCRSCPMLQPDSKFQASLPLVYLHDQHKKGNHMCQPKYTHLRSGDFCATVPRMKASGLFQATQPRMDETAAQPTQPTAQSGMPSTAQALSPLQTRRPTTDQSVAPVVFTADTREPAAAQVPSQVAPARTGSNTPMVSILSVSSLTDMYGRHTSWTRAPGVYSGRAVYEYRSL